MVKAILKAPVAVLPNVRTALPAPSETQIKKSLPKNCYVPVVAPFTPTEVL